MSSLHDLPAILRAAGLQVTEHPGWQGKSTGDGSFAPQALLLHHDGSPPGYSRGALEWELNQFGPPTHGGAQLFVDYSGTWHVIAAGRCWHAGVGRGIGLIRRDRGNEDSLGVETDHTTGEAWPPEQWARVLRGVVAICRAYGWTAFGHREYAPGRKDDPAGVDLPALRAAIAAAPVNAESLDPAAPPEDEDMLWMLKADDDESVFLAGPGLWRHVPNPATRDSLVYTGISRPPAEYDRGTFDRIATMCMPGEPVDVAALASRLAELLPHAAGDITADLVAEALTHVQATTTLASP